MAEIVPGDDTVVVLPVQLEQLSLVHALILKGAGLLSLPELKEIVKSLELSVGTTTAVGFAGFVVSTITGVAELIQADVLPLNSTVWKNPKSGEKRVGAGAYGTAMCDCGLAQGCQKGPQRPRPCPAASGLVRTP